MKYIGNKTRVINFIKSSLEENEIKYNNIKVIDLFAGTGSVSKFFLQNNCNVISCDNMTYSICEQYRTNYFRREPNFKEIDEINNGTLNEVLELLNNLNGEKGYFYENYAPEGKYGRQYFSNNNAQKIDAIRNKIESWKILLPNDKYNFLLGILMCAADKVSNTSGTYGAYLKIWRSMALKDIYLEKPEFYKGGKNIIIQDDVITCAQKYKADIIYMDPPYNSRQYASNFHVLENIVVNDKQLLKGKTGLREYKKQKSNYCMKKLVLKEFEKLINECNAKYIILSYSTEGLMTKEEIEKVLRKKGTCKICEQKYRRFKTNAWTESNTNLNELLFICRTK